MRNLLEHRAKSKRGEQVSGFGVVRMLTTVLWECALCWVEGGMQFQSLTVHTFRRSAMDISRLR